MNDTSVNNGTGTGTGTGKSEFLDADFEDYVSTSEEWETVPTNWYDLVVDDLTVREKSEKKIRADWALRKVDHPNTLLEDIDPKQWVWTLRIAAGDYEGLAIIVKTSRSFHERSIAGKLAAAALGLSKWDTVAARSIAQAAGKSGTGVLMGKRLRGSVTADPDAQGKMWNNCKQFEPWQPPRQRPPKPTEQRQREAVPRRQLAGYPQDLDDSDPVQDF